MTDSDLVGYFEALLPESLALLKQMVELESHSLDKQGVDELAQFLAREFEARGAAARILSRPERGNLLQCSWAKDDPVGCGKLKSHNYTHPSSFGNILSQKARKLSS